MGLLSRAGAGDGRMEGHCRVICGGPPRFLLSKATWDPLVARSLLHLALPHAPRVRRGGGKAGEQHASGPFASPELIYVFILLFININKYKLVPLSLLVEGVMVEGVGDGNFFFTGACPVSWWP